MSKAKVAAIVCGLITSCLLGGFAVVEAATITLDDSSAIDTAVYVTTVAEETTEFAAAETSIETSTVAIATGMTATTDAKTTVTTVDSTDMTTLAETTAADDSAETDATSTVKAIAVIKETAALPARQTAPETETTTKATTTTTKATTISTTKATTTTTTVATTKATTVTTTTEAVLTNPPMPTQTGTAAPEFDIPPVEDVQESYDVTPDEPVVEASSSSVSISDSDYILLCNAVAHEAGSDSISATDKAKVVEVIMNRVNSSSYPNTIYGVLTQKYQFSGSSSYVDLGTYSSKVTDKDKAAVDLYFADPSAFNHGYLSFTGDGTRNYFS